ncbi:MAG: T9SS type A sorting domain-containing protein [Bacteroidia bacterium]
MLSHLYNKKAKPRPDFSGLSGKKIITTGLIVLVFQSYVFSQNGLTVYPPPTGYTNQQLLYRNDLKIDNNNNAWVAFRDIGLGKFDGTSWTVYNPSNSGFPDNTVYEIAFDASQNLWAGTNVGLVKYDGTNFTVYNSSNSTLPYDTIRAVSINGNDKWLGTNVGAVKFDGTNSVVYNTGNSGIVNDTATAFAFGANGEINIGTANGFSIFYNSTWTNYNSSNSNLVNSRINYLYVDSDNELWIGSRPVGSGSGNFVYKLAGGLILEFGSDIYKGTVPVASANSYDFFEYNPGKMLFHSGGMFLEEDPEEFKIFLGVYVSSIISLGINIDKAQNGIVWLIGKRQGGGSPPNFLYAFDFSQHTNYCYGFTNENYKSLDINSVNALMLNRGDMHWDLNNSKYEVPKGSGINSVYASSLWIGGMDQAGQLRLAAMTYRQTGADFWPGPIDTVSGIADSISVEPYDRIWKVNRFDVEDFKYNWLNGNVGNGTYLIPKDIAQWPAHGTGNISRNLAPFVDINSDGIYDPYDGDYPQIKGDQMLYWIFNDNLSIHEETNGLPLGFEIHASAYAYTCPLIADSNAVLNTTTLYNYRIINRSGNNYDSLFIGLWCDVDLGSAGDDYVGCDTSLHTGFVYNGDNDDDLNQGGYGLNPPMQNVQILKGPEPVLSDGIDNNHDGTVDETGELCMMDCFHPYISDFGSTGNPFTPDGFYYYITSRWLDGTHITYGNSGYGGAIPTNFMFSGIPYDPSGWTEFISGNVPADRRFVMSSGPFSLTAGEETSIDFAYVFTRDSTAPNGLTTSIAHNTADLQRVKYWFDTDSFPSCLLLNVAINEQPEENLSFNIYPNPVESNLSVVFSKLSVDEKSEIKILDIMGRDVLKSEIQSRDIGTKSEIKINVSSLLRGVYILQLKAGDKIYRKKFVKG